MDVWHLYPEKPTRGERLFGERRVQVVEEEALD